MIRTSNKDLFHVSLTEVVVVLFFILLLCAFAEIASLIDDSDNLSAQVEVLEVELRQSESEIQRQGEVLRAFSNESDSVGIPSDQIIARIDPDAPAEDLSPVQEVRRALDLIDVLRTENAELNEEIRQRNALAKSSAAASNEEIPQLLGSEGECLGSFIDCAQHCWPLDAAVEGSTREYEYLLDIGFCEGTYLVEPSLFEIAGEYTNADLNAISPAREVTERNVLNGRELGQYLQKIRAWGENRPKDTQCKFAANLVDLESTKSQWTLASDRGPVPQNLFTNIVNQNDTTYAEYRARFDVSTCTTVTQEESSGTLPIPELQISEEPSIVATDRMSEVAEAVEDPATDTTPDPIVEMEARLNWEGRIECPRRSFRNSPMNILMTVDVAVDGEISFSYPATLTNAERRVAELLEAAISEDGATVPVVDGEYVASSKTYVHQIPENICR